MKTIQNDFFLKNKNLFLFNPPKRNIKKSKNPFFYLLLIAGSGTSHVTISLIGFAPHT